MLTDLLSLSLAHTEREKERAREREREREMQRSDDLCLVMFPCVCFPVFFRVCRMRLSLSVSVSDSVFWCLGLASVCVCIVLFVCVCAHTVCAHTDTDTDTGAQPPTQTQTHIDRPRQGTKTHPKHALRIVRCVHAPMHVRVHTCAYTVPGLFSMAIYFYLFIIKLSVPVSRVVFNGKFF